MTKVIILESWLCSFCNLGHCHFLSNRNKFWFAEDSDVKIISAENVHHIITLCLVKGDRKAERINLR